MARNPDPKKWQSGWQRRPHNFDPNTMGKDKKRAGLAYWNKRLLPKPGEGEEAPTPLTWKQIKESEGFKKGQFNEFYANRPKNLRGARDRFQARKALSKKFGGGEDGKLMSWQDIKANKGYKKGAFQRKLKKMRKSGSSIYDTLHKRPQPKPEEEQS